MTTLNTVSSVRLAPQHTAVDDTAGIATGAFLASLGVFLLDAGGAVTGGTAGVGLLRGHIVPWPFAAIYVAVNLPFIVLAGIRKGRGFAIRSVTSVGLVSALSLVHAHAVTITDITPVYAAPVGNLALGIGILILFRHRSSLGGFNVVALNCQERLGWRAGYVQLLLDAIVIVLATLVAPASTALLSGIGTVILNLVLAMNHRPGRYLTS